MFCMLYAAAIHFRKSIEIRLFGQTFVIRRVWFCAVHGGFYLSHRCWAKDTFQAYLFVCPAIESCRSFSLHKA